jgi:hypothetical protein
MTIPALRKHTLLGLVALVLCLTLLALGPALFAAHVHAGGAGPASLPHDCPLVRAAPRHSCAAR